MEIGNQNFGSNAEGTNQDFTAKVKILNSSEMENEQLLREELALERDARLRLAADYENYRRRVKRENERAVGAARRELLKRILSVADDLDLAAAHLGETTDAVSEGLKLVRRRFDELLRANEVQAFKSEGEKFDPELHEAFDVVSGTESAPGTVETEIRRGYLLKDKLLRPALVVVAQ
jgi:molecular chaperone GrpE